ncbi:hypothetical protein [Bacillus sp. Marseille-Q3570]|uniref:hypothetical protein n=1 Tax=Bacillus sp. Marseille-Q3570 TaxID=2963522 RepID=UPI0021B7C24D|nr:hypothetical protein [Bacillus sp. Marseille-Q3570]
MFEYSKLINQFLDDPMKWTNQKSNMDMSWLEQYIQQTIQQSVGNQSAYIQPHSLNSVSPNQNGLRHELVELMNYYVVKLQVAEGIDIKQLRISLGNSRLIVSGLPDGQSESIQLPGPTAKRGFKAQYKHPFVEVRLLKTNDDTLNDIPIDY